MFAIEKYILLKPNLLLVSLCFCLVATSQTMTKMDTIDKKMDTVLMLLRKTSTVVPKVEKEDCSKVLSAKETLHKQELDKVKTQLDSKTQESIYFSKEKEALGMKLTLQESEMQKAVTQMLSNTIKNGVYSDAASLESLIQLGVKYKAGNTKEFENYVAVSKEVLALQLEFSKMNNPDSTTGKAWGLHSKSYNYPALHNEVKNLIFKLTNYCEYEKKLIDAIELSKTQSSEENRKKQLLRREDDFIDYPNLKTEIDKIKANKNHSFIPKCKS
jgi:hypothetical protein